MWAEQDYLEPKARIGYFPANSDGNDVVVFDPEDQDKEIARLTFPRQPKHDRICLADFYKPIDSNERDVVAIQGVTVGPKSTERLAELEQAGEFAEQLFTHGLAVQSAEGLAEWLHARARAELGIDADQGRRYSWGYPACPDQSEHTKVWELLDLEQIGMTLSDGFAVMPEQSTVAIIAHHPQAVYFGMKSGFVPKGKRPDELIAGTARGGDLPPDADPDGDGTVEAEETAETVEA
jgi:5-methyltetrahydrofolate--homocysteine methyltransferase